MSSCKSILILVFCILAACDPGSQGRLDKETFEAEQRRREPRRLKEGEITEAVRQQGNALAERLQRQAGESPGCCPVLSQSLQDSLSQQQIRVSCLRLDAPPSTELEQQERELLDAYQYSWEQGQPLEPNVQPLGKEAFLYTAPVSPMPAAEKPCAIWSIRLLRRQVIQHM
ncbi:hypothetical protein [Cesiribacter andamanensis]|uniref:Lipoprotein n=1 Tax=Cesiribacter andamanensis AMV16 TaxID=1279009 RepID=M7NWT8_9BACT|nr:hypothetical protein [Cesiribacter andamanensis]EMR02919.1 hypothetical protein ADICEAN_01957 [Cesiribacter andamanensis AMV16]